MKNIKNQAGAELCQAQEKQWIARFDLQFKKMRTCYLLFAHNWCCLAFTFQLKLSVIYLTIKAIFQLFYNWGGFHLSYNWCHLPFLKKMRSSSIFKKMRSYSICQNVEVVLQILWAYLVYFTEYPWFKLYELLEISGATMDVHREL